MTPSPPSAQIGSASASSPAITAKRSGRPRRISVTWSRLPEASLTATKRGSSASSQHRLGRQVAAGAAGHVVEHHRHAHRVGDGAEVRQQAVLLGLVVVGRDDEHGVGAGLLAALRQLRRLVGVVGAGAGDHLARRAPRAAPRRRSPRRRARARRATASPPRRWCPPAPRRRRRRRSGGARRGAAPPRRAMPSARNGVTRAVNTPCNRRTWFICSWLIATSSRGTARR